MKISQKITRSLFGIGLLMLCFAILQSCGKAENLSLDPEKLVTPVAAPKPGASTSKVYVVGHTRVGGLKMATVWKDGVATVLGEAGVESTASGIFVSGTDVYICGAENNVAKYWKNGTALGSISTERSADGIAVTGNDVWVLAGSALWKNGIAEHLNTPSPEARVEAIAATGKDFYACVGTDMRLAVLTNGKFSFVSVPPSETAFTSAVSVGYGIAEAFSMVVSGEDLYIGGFQDINGVAVAMYWKNGTEFKLNATGFDPIRSIAVKESAVYSVAGGNFYLNTLKQALPADLAEVQLVGASGADLYLFGFKANRSLYLKNGIKVDLPGEGATIRAFAIL